MKLYLMIGFAALLLGIVTGVGLGGRTADENSFQPNNAEKPRDEVPSSSTPSNAKPRAVVVNGETFDFGSMRRGKSMSHTFYIRNSGNAPLKLETRTTTCKCTISKLEKNEVVPNDIVGVTLEWEVNSENESFRQTAVIWSNDPTREFIQLKIEGLVEDTIRIVPPGLRFVNVSGNETTSRTFRVYGSPAVEELLLVEHEFTEKPTAEFFDLSVRPLTEEEIAEDELAAHGYEVTVNIKPGLPTGDINQTIRLKTSVPEAPDFMVPVQGNVIADISVLGRGVKFDTDTSILSLGGVDRATGAEAELLVLVKGPHKDDIQMEVDSIDPVEGLEVTLGERRVTEKLVTYLVTVRVPAGAPPMTRLGSDQGALGRITLKTNHPTTKEIPIRVQFSIY